MVTNLPRRVSAGAADSESDPAQSTRRKESPYSDVGTDQGRQIWKDRTGSVSAPDWDKTTVQMTGKKWLFGSNTELDAIYIKHYVNLANQKEDSAVIGYALAGGAAARSLAGAAEAVMARSAATAAQADATATQFGRVQNQVFHTFRHTDALGLDQSVVQSAVEAHLRTVQSQIVAGKPFNQVIEVAGIRLQYTAFRLSDGVINVGRIHP